MRASRQPSKEDDKYNMTIPDDKACDDCRNFERCNKMYGAVSKEGK